MFPGWEVAVLALLACAFQATAAEEAKPPEPSTNQRLDNLDNDAVAILRQVPGVAQVTRHGPEGHPSHRIVHLLDWHFVPKDMFAADLRSQSDEPIADEEIDRAWEEHLREVSGADADPESPGST